MTRRLAARILVCVTLLLLVFSSGLNGAVSAQSVDDLAEIQDKIDENKFTAENVAIALAMILGAYLVSRIVGWILHRALKKIRNEKNELYLAILERGIRYLIVGVGIVGGLDTIGLNVAWVSVGFGLIIVIVFLTLRPLIESLSAGILLRTRESFSLGGEVKHGDYKGKITEITARSTVIKTSDWRKIHIPNTEILSNEIVVYSGFSRRRSYITLEILYDTPIETVEKLLISTVRKIDGVLKKPVPSVSAKGFGQGTYILSVSWWHKSSLSAEAQTKDKVVRAVKKAFDTADISMPSPEYIITTRSED